MDNFAPPGDRFDLITKLAGGLVHEIKNPLSTLQINLHLLAEDWGHPKTPKEERLLKKIELLGQETRRLERILDDFLRYARTSVVHIDACRVNRILEEVLEFTGPDLAASKIQMWKSLSPDLPVIKGDPALLKQAFLNLVINARDAMPQGGELICKSYLDAGWIVIDVIDTGAGIAPARIARIFDIYFSTKPNGTGLGLPTSRRIVEEHGGTLTVESEQGKGSRFSVRIPPNAGEICEKRVSGRVPKVAS